jgi:ectoine hydroxylase-related dioxygenase (phytanoyl-CoA dioxygenase family)
MIKMHLNDQQKKQFEEDGYIILEKVFNDEEVIKMQAEAQFIADLIINSSIENKRCSGRIDVSIQDNGNHTLRKIQPINDLSLYLTQISNDERFVGPLEDIMGDKSILMEEKLNYKQPLDYKIEGFNTDRHGDNFPIHNDWAYFKANGYPQEILSSAISMDDCNINSGPIYVWPGSHKSHLEHEHAVPRGLQVKEGLIDKDAGVPVIAKAGTVMIFHSLLVHSSSENISGKPRRLMIYSHYPKSTNMGFDQRNGRARLRESPYELEYLRSKLSQF